MPGSGLAPFQRSSVHIQEDQPRFEQCCLSAQRYPDTPRQSSPLHTTETLLKLCEERKSESRGFTLAVYNLSSSRSSLWGCFRGCSPAWSTPGGWTGRRQRQKDSISVLQKVSRLSHSCTLPLCSYPYFGNGTQLPWMGNPRHRPGGPSGSSSRRAADIGGALISTPQH